MIADGAFKREAEPMAMCSLAPLHDPRNSGRRRRSLMEPMVCPEDFSSERLGNDFRRRAHVTGGVRGRQIIVIDFARFDGCVLKCVPGEQFGRQEFPFLQIKFSIDGTIDTVSCDVLLSVGRKKD